MTSKIVTPLTMAGIKRLAKQIKASTYGLTHHESLNRASKAAGFKNFRHAQKHLHDSAKQPTKIIHEVFLTAYWRDNKTNTTGRETLIVSLEHPWTKLLSTSELKLARGLEYFRSEGPDHLCRSAVVRSQAFARESVCHAARTLQFVATSRLHPSRGYSRAYPKGNADNRVPGQDHACVWFDDKKRYLIADEPYEQSVELKRTVRNAWRQAHGYSEEPSAWPGMHNPFGGTRLYLLSDDTKGAPLIPLIKALDQLPIPPSSDDWMGESAPMHPYFVSPASVEKK